MKRSIHVGHATTTLYSKFHSNPWYSFEMRVIFPLSERQIQNSEKVAGQFLRNS